MPEDIRLPPFMVPSDLDPSIEPPPPIERDEAMEEGDEDEDGDENAGSGQEDADQDEDMSGGSDDDGKKSKKSSKEKKAVKKKKSSAKEKKSSSKEKKASSSSKSKKESAGKEKKSSKKDSAEDKKRKKPSASDAGSDGVAATKVSPSKVAKKEKATDVKSEVSAEKHAKVNKAKGEKKAPDATAADSLSGEALSAVLEKEIKWILANCQFEEMTTKTVRKLLEKRLKMDLRNHKTSIKESVARVIAAMEDGMDAGAGDEEAPAVKEEAAAPEKKEPVPVATTDADAPSEAVADSAANTVVQEDHIDEPEPVTESSEEQDVKKESEPSVAQQLEDAERELGLATNDDAKIASALGALQKQVPSVEREVLSSSALLPKLVALRAHEEKTVSKQVASLAKQWDVEDLVPAPQPIREEDILAMKEKLESTETSHDDMLTCLSQLATVGGFGMCVCVQGSRLLTCETVVVSTCTRCAWGSRI